MNRCCKYFFLIFATTFVLASGKLYAVDYVVSGTNSIAPTTDGWPPTLTLQAATLDTLTVNSGAILNNGAGPDSVVVAVQGNNTLNIFGTVTNNNAGHTINALNTGPANPLVRITIADGGAVTANPTSSAFLDAINLTALNPNPTITIANSGAISGRIVLPTTTSPSTVTFQGTNPTLTGNIVTTTPTNYTVNINTSNFVFNANAGASTSNFATLNVGIPAGSAGTTVLGILQITQANLGNNSFITLSGASSNIQGTIVGTGSTNTNLNIQSGANFTPSAAITNVTNINVLSGGTFNIPAAFPPIGFSMFNIASGGTTNLLGSFSIGGGTLNDNGTLTMNGFTLSGGAGSTLNIGNANTTTFSNTGPISGITTINVGGVGVAGTIFNVNNAVTGFTSFSIASGGTTNLNVPLNLGGGTLTDNGTLNMNAALNLGGGTLTDNGTLKMNGFAINGPGSLNINSTFTNSGIIGFPVPVTSVTVNSPGVFAFNQPVFATNFTNNSGTVLLMNQATPFQLTGTYLQNAGGFLTTDIVSEAGHNYGSLAITGSAALNGTIHVALPGDPDLIHTGDTFDILTTTGALVNNAALTTQPNAFVTFSYDPSAPPNIIRLIANVSSFSTVNTNPTLAGVAGALDVIAKNNPPPGLENIIDLLLASPNAAAFEEDLAELAPVRNGGIVLSTFYSFDLALDKITNLSYRRLLLSKNENSGYSAGDFAHGWATYGPFFFGNIQQQNPVNGIAGYESGTEGAGYLADVPLFCYFRLGGAFSYAYTTVTDNSFAKNKTYISSYQGSVYASYDYSMYFADGIVSFAFNNYRTNRHIPFLGTTAKANYSGHQTGGRFRFGFSIPYSTIQIAPMGVLFAYSLKLDGFAENSADGANLAVAPRTVALTEAGFGLRLMDISTQDLFLPEIHVYFLNTINNPNLAVTGQFIEAGPVFVTAIPNIPSYSVDLGISASANINGVLFIAGYDAEIRKQFVSHSMILKVRWTF